VASARAVDVLLESIQRTILLLGDLVDLVPQLRTGEAEALEQGSWSLLRQAQDEAGVLDSEESKSIVELRAQRGPVKEILAVMDTVWSDNHSLEHTKLYLSAETWLQALS